MAFWSGLCLTIIVFSLDWGAKGNGKKKRWWLFADALRTCWHNDPDLLETCERLSADKGYDDSKLIERLWDQHPRPSWKDSDAEEDGVRTKHGQENVIYRRPSETDGG